AGSGDPFIIAIRRESAAFRYQPALSHCQSDDLRVNLSELMPPQSEQPEGRPPGVNLRAGDPAAALVEPDGNGGRGVIGDVEAGADSPLAQAETRAAVIPVAHEGVIFLQSGRDSGPFETFGVAQFDEEAGEADLTVPLPGNEAGDLIPHPAPRAVSVVTAAEREKTIHQIKPLPGFADRGEPGFGLREPVRINVGGFDGEILCGEAPAFCQT